MSTSNVIVLYALSHELRAVQKYNEEMKREPKCIHPNAYSLKVELTTDRKCLFDALVKGFAFEGNNLRFFVRQPIAHMKHAWLLVSDYNMEIFVDSWNHSNVVLMQVSCDGEYPYLCGSEEPRWWGDLVEPGNLPKPVAKVKPKTTNEPASRRAHMQRSSSTDDTSSRSSHSSGIPMSAMSMQDTFKKTTQSMNSVLSWAKKGFSKATEAMSTTETVTLTTTSVSFVKKLADGGFSEVFLVRDCQNPNMEYALKRCLAHSRNEVTDLEQEIMLHQRAASPYVMKLLDTVQKASQRVSGAKEIMFLFPLYSAGSINDQMMQYAETGNGQWPFPEEAALYMLKGILQGVQAIHNLGYAHRDIKPHNILLSVPDGMNAPFLPAHYRAVTPILMDLGSAAPVSIKLATRNEASMAVDEASVKCSAPHRAPELFDIPSVPYELMGDKTDMWSVGTTLYAMTFGQMYSPFEHPTQGVQTLAIRNGTLKFSSSMGYSSKLKSLVTQILQVDPSKRPSIRAVLEKLKS